MAAEEASLLGLMVGDGLPVQLTARLRNTAQLAARLASDLFADRLLSRVDQERRWYRVYLAARGRLTDRVRNPAAQWLEQLGAFALRSSEKRAPDRIFSQSEQVIASFLRHLWAADGSVWLDREGDHRPSIYYATDSGQLARDVQSLLLRIGINATQSPVGLLRGRPGFQVEVSGGPDMHRFLCVVGDLDPEEELELEEVLEYLEAQPTAQPSPRQASAASAQRRPGGGAGSPELEAPVEGEVYWDRVRSIESAGVEEVFDLTVPGLHNFVADDIVVHNSIEQDADLVMFLYRDEYYNPESEDQGIAELHLSKHRNGPIGTVKLVFLSHYPKFANLTRTQPPVEQSSSDGSSLPDIPDLDEPEAAAEES
jgi:replicative DNA helicase